MIIIIHQFLGPRGPLRLPLMSVPSVVRPSATKIHATSHYSFSDSKLILFLFQTLSSHNLSHSTQNTEQDHLADLSSPIWSCLLFWTLSPEPLSLVQLRNKGSPYFAKSWGRWWNYFDHPEPLKSEMEKAFWIAPMQIGPQILAPKKHKLRLIRVTTKQHKSPKRPWKIWK